MTMTSTPNVRIVAGLNLGNATLSSPVRQRARNSRRSTLSTSAINAIRLNNELVGETGNVLPVPGPNRTLFSPTPFNPTSPSTLGTARSQTPSASTPHNAAQSTNTPPPPPRGAPAGRVIVVDGRPLRLAQLPASQDDFIVARLYDKTKRHELDADSKQTFVDSVTGFALSKKNKLRTLSTREDDDGILAHVTNLKSQLQTLQNHLISYDVADVFTIISAHDVLTTGAILADDDGNPLAYDLFTDYPKLHVAEVAGSNAWHNTWIAPEQPHVKENLKFTLDFLQNNTDETLWAKCMEDCVTYHPIQQGGPLMLYLILS